MRVGFEHCSSVYSINCLPFAENEALAGVAKCVTTSAAEGSRVDEIYIHIYIYICVYIYIYIYI